MPHRSTAKTAWAADLTQTDAHPDPPDPHPPFQVFAPNGILLILA
jgi:hypothetical protein